MNEVESPCADCGVDTLPTDGPRAEYYVVTKEVWEAAGMPHAGFLCIGCLESRLGRLLCAADFTDCPLNDPATVDVMRYAWSWRTPRLTDRLSR
jgi:hypothetical protein